MNLMIKCANMKDKPLHSKLDIGLTYEEKTKTDTQKFNIKFTNIFLQ